MYVLSSGSEITCNSINFSRGNLQAKLLNLIKLFGGIIMYTFLTKLRPTEEFRSDQVKFPEATPTDLWGWLNIT